MGGGWGPGPGSGGLFAGPPVDVSVGEAGSSSRDPSLGAWLGDRAADSPGFGGFRTGAGWRRTPALDIQAFVPAMGPDSCVVLDKDSEPPQASVC